jgi:hypothetical protein
MASVGKGGLGRASESVALESEPAPALDFESEISMTVSNTILAQLGGSRFIAMTGASSFTGSANALSFKLPGKSGFVKNGIRGVRIVLDPSDTYTVAFYAWRKKGGVSDFKIISEYSDIYAENLRGLFERETGLRTSL